MTRFTATFSVFLTLLLVASPASPADYDAGTQSPLRFGVGARDLSLGGAALARCDAVAAPFWNASRLATAEYFAVGGFHTQLFDSDVAYQYLGVTLPTLDFGVFGFGIQRLGVSNIEKRDVDNVLLGSFSDSRLGFHFGYGRALGSYRVGVAMNLEHHSLDSYKATSSPGVSLAVTRSFGYVTNWFHEVDMSVSANNVISPSVELQEESVTHPAALDVGFSADLWPASAENHRLELSVRATKVEHIQSKAALGLEFTYSGMLSVRGGIRDSEFSGGVGIDYRGFRFDYAVVDRDLGLLHMFGVTTAFGASMTERRQLRAERREAEFQQEMHANLINRNRATVEDLLTAGRSALNTGDLPQAVGSLDRALFIARSSGLDTTTVAELYAEAARRLERTTQMARYTRHLDLARERLRSDDLLGARYHANMAVEAYPASQEARDILEDVREQMRSNTAREDIVRGQIQQIDSLLTYGRYEEAVSRARSLGEAAPDDKVVQQLGRRARFEKLRHEGERAFAEGSYDEALETALQADKIFPNHQWCERMRESIAEIKQGAAEKLVAETVPGPVQLSDGARQQVEALYESARSSFESGRLEDAIAGWERVEKLAPGYMSVREYLVKAYKYLGVERYGENDLNRAITMWRRAAELEPENEEIRAYIRRAESEIMRLKELSYEQ